MRLLCCLGCALWWAVAGRAAPAPEPHPVREIKYTAGPDGHWFTADDPVYHTYAYTFGTDGRVVSMTCARPGPDGKPGTPDDITDYVQAHSPGPHGAPVCIRTFASPGPDGRWHTADDQPRWTEIFFYDRDGNRERCERELAAKVVRVVTYARDRQGREVRDVEHGDPGPDSVWNTPDDTVEKYHRYAFDAAGRRIRAEECHARHRGAGSDGRWFTDDDVVSSTKLTQRDAQGRKVRDLKAIGPGSDGAWFTDDDNLQYYSVFEYAK